MVLHQVYIVQYLSGKGTHTFIYTSSTVSRKKTAIIKPPLPLLFIKFGNKQTAVGEF